MRIAFVSVFRYRAITGSGGGVNSLVGELCSLSADSFEVLMQ